MEQNNKLHEDEKWVEMWDFPKYEISNKGNVRNAKTGRPLSIRVDGNQYRMVSVWDKKVHTKRVGRYVWMSFNKQFCKATVDHINNDKLDDRVENLQCISVKENNDKRRKTKGVKSNIYNLTPELKGQIHKSLVDGTETTWTIMKKYGIPLNYMGLVKKRNSWKKYAE